MTDPKDLRIQALEAELAAARADLQAFTATVSHDLRAPLRHIMAYAQMVQEDAGPQLDAEVQGFLGTIVDSAKHMGVLLDGLTALSRLATVPVHCTAVDLGALVQEACDELQARHAARAVEWRIAQDLRTAHTAHVDAALLRQVLGYVLGNALKFTAPRPQTVIAVGVDQVDGQLHLQVRDNGVGYNPAMQDKLFQVFGRLHSAKQFEGIGMGLALAAKALERMGASITIAGEVDGGCCVTLHLPVRSVRGGFVTGI